MIAPIQDRIVQRAILEVLAGTKALTNVQRILETPTSVGGIPERGVDTAIAIFDERVDAGDRFVGGSDISGFFTKIRRKSVVDYVRQDTNDEDFLGLLDRALSVELANADQLDPADRKLFPTDQDGVAQGCPLSALAGNIVLEQFDRQMNEAGRGVTCIRYIDDFLLVGRTMRQVERAMKSAKSTLAKLGMDIYDPETTPSKAFKGEIGEPHVFLGYEIIPGRYRPAQPAQDKLLGQVDALFKAGITSIKKAKSGKTLSPSDRTYAETLLAVSNTVRGWRGSFRSSQCSTTDAALDKQIDRRLDNFNQTVRRIVSKCDNAQKRRVLGVVNIAEVGLMARTKKEPHA